MSHQRVWIVLHYTWDGSDGPVRTRLGQVGRRVYSSSESAKASLTFFATRIDLGVARWRWHFTRWVLTDDDLGRVATVEQRQVWP